MKAPFVSAIVAEAEVVAIGIEKIARADIAIGKVVGASSSDLWIDCRFHVSAFQIFVQENVRLTGKMCDIGKAAESQTV